MLEEILLYLHNWFCNPDDIRVGRYHVDAGYLDLPFLQDGQYYRICGSALNDGVYQYPTMDLADEVFTGAIWPLHIPPALLMLVTEIEDWQSQYGSGAAIGPYQSESFGGYSYTKASSSGSNSSGSSSAVTWIDAFSTRLTGWRKM